MVKWLVLSMKSSLMDLWFGFRRMLGGQTVTFEPKTKLRNHSCRLIGASQTNLAYEETLTTSVRGGRRIQIPFHISSPARPGVGEEAKEGGEAETGPRPEPPPYPKSRARTAGGSPSHERRC